MTSTRTRSLISLSIFVILAVACRHDDGVAGEGSQRGGSVAIAGLTDTEWRLTHLGGTRVIPSSGERYPFLRLASAEGRIEGFTTCNQFSGPYELDGQRVRLSGPAISTKMACADPALNAQEQRFLAALESLDRYSIDGDVLTLYSSAGVIARLERVDG